MSSVTPRNADRITKPVAVRAALLGLLGLATAFGIDLNVSEAQTGALSDLLIALLPLLGTLAGGLWGTSVAREGVTPIGPGDIPRNAEGVELKPAGHTPATGYPERVEPPRPQPRHPRVDRRGIDRDPGDLG
jgi:hypothetical protein